MLLILLLLLALPLPAQVERIYRTAPAFNGRVDTLRMHIWPSATDGLNNPLIVWIHGGGFIEGSYRALDSTCKRYAMRGYTAVTVQYRLGIYGPFPLDPPFSYDRAEPVRACWRGVQDIRAALRFLIDHAGEFAIDTTCITLAGESAGAILALQTTIADASDSIPREVGTIADVQRGFDRFPRPALGALDTDPARPLPPITSVVNYYGALMHPYMLDVAAFPAVFSYHQTGDLVVACGANRAFWGLPLDVGANWPVLNGTCTIEQLLSGGGHDPSRRVTMIHEGLGHELHNPRLVDSLTAAFLDVHRCDRATSVNEEGVKGWEGGRSERRNRETDNGRWTSDAGYWTAYDVMGRVVAAGDGGMNAAIEWHSEQHGGVVFVVCGTQRRTLVH